MHKPESERYLHRNVEEWLNRARDGAIALPTFQRSYVWDNDRTAQYLRALFQDRPTGTFLVLKADPQSQLPFKARNLKGLDADTDRPEELLLDGQQRLTSLWNALRGTRPGEEREHRFFVQVESLRKLQMGVKDVVFFSNNSKKGRERNEPRVAFDQHLVPLDILWDTQNGEEADEADRYKPGRIFEWCEAARGQEKAPDSRRLEKAISEALGAPLRLARNLWHCALPPDTPARDAVDIFVQTNRSSATIKRFDIAVAIAQGQYEEDLRQRISDFRQQSEEARHYSSNDEEKAIPDIGEWLLKVACLHVGLAPREGRYEEALDGLFKDGLDNGVRQLEEVQQHVNAALRTMAEHGAATESTLPAWPAVWVVAALQPHLSAVSQAQRQPGPRMSRARSLVSSYVWRSFFTDRYLASANDRLFEDFQRLKACLDHIRQHGRFEHESLPPAFDDEEHPLPTAKELSKNLPWISRARQGRALPAIVTSQRPIDWVTGEPLDAAAIRRVEREGKLHRHHIFPRDFLKKQFEKETINHGLNGILLTKKGNLYLSKKDPIEYLQALGEEAGLSKKDVRQRVRIPPGSIRRPNRPGPAPSALP